MLPVKMTERMRAVALDMARWMPDDKKRRFTEHLSTSKSQDVHLPIDLIEALYQAANDYDPEDQRNINVSEDIACDLYFIIQDANGTDPLHDKDARKMTAETKYVSTAKGSEWDHLFPEWVESDTYPCRFVYDLENEQLVRASVFYEDAWHLMGRESFLDLEDSLKNANADNIRDLSNEGLAFTDVIPSWMEGDALLEASNDTPAPA